MEVNCTAAAAVHGERAQDGDRQNTFMIIKVRHGVLGPQNIPISISPVRFG